MRYLMKGGAALLISLAIAGIAAVASAQTPGGETVCTTLVRSDLRFGSRDRAPGGEILLLQGFLRSKGYLDAEPTGYFGALTRQAVKDFQTENGLSPVGLAGPLTRARIREVSCNNPEQTFPAPASTSSPQATPAPALPAADPSVSIISPNGGETWLLNTAYFVRWQTNRPGTMQVYLRFPDGGTCNIGSAPALAGYLAVALRATDCQNVGRGIVSGQYQLAIILHKYADMSDIGLARDLSDGLITIAP